jgi:V-type H+-transporting ATPase subunit a
MRPEDAMAKESMFRSSPMSLIQLYIPVEAAQAVTLRAGDLGLIQFRDVLNIYIFHNSN